MQKSNCKNNRNLFLEKSDNKVMQVKLKVKLTVIKLINSDEVKVILTLLRDILEY